MFVTAYAQFRVAVFNFIFKFLALLVVIWLSLTVDSVTFTFA